MSSPEKPPTASGTDDAAAAGFEQRVRALLNDSAAQLDGRTRSRLTQARYAALAHLAAHPRRSPWLRWAPASAVAMAVLATLLYVGQRGADAPLTNPAGAPPSTTELLADADALELTAELDAELDYDFYNGQPQQRAKAIVGWARSVAARAPVCWSAVC
jgi:negative regulator of sigma E activity